MKNIVYALVVIATILFMNSKLYSQNKIDATIIFEILKWYKVQQSNFIIKSKWKDVVVLEDPITGIQEVHYPENVPDIIKKEIESYPITDAIQILNQQFYADLFCMDTVYLVDTTGFFKPNLFATFDKKSIKVISKVEEKPKGYIYLNAIGIRGDFLLLSLGIKSMNSEDTLTFYFDIRNDFALIKSNTLYNSKR